MRYKDQYPIFKTYWRGAAVNNSVLSEARWRGRAVFLIALCKVLRWDIKLKGFKKAVHDMFIGTRVL